MGSLVKINFLQERCGLGEPGLISLYSYKNAFKIISFPNLALFLPSNSPLSVVPEMAKALISLIE